MSFERPCCPEPKIGCGDGADGVECWPESSQEMEGWGEAHEMSF